MAVSTIKSSGGDFTSLSAWEAAKQADLTGLGPEEAECYNLADTTAVTIAGWTTTSSDYIRIYAATGEGHAGVWSTSKYRLSVSTTFAYILIINEDFVRLEGLQIEGTAAADGNGNISITGTAVAASSDIRVDRCLIRKGSSRNTAGQNSVTCGSGKTTIRNSVIYGSLGGTAVAGLVCTFDSNAATLNCDNLTIAVGSLSHAFNRVGGTLTVRNSYAHGSTDSYTGTMTLTTCMHSSASTFTGSTASIAHDTTNFTNVTAGNEDYHLIAGSDLIDAGTDLSADFTIDIDGATRSGTWDVGADEVTAAATAIARNNLLLLGVT